MFLPSKLPKQKDEPLNLPSVIEFLQVEFRKFEREREFWEVERAQLQARIAQLEGEKRVQESLKFDLVRRVKMLETALRQERIKYSKSDLKQPPPPPAVPLSEELRAQADSSHLEKNRKTISARMADPPGARFPKSAEVIRRYLEEIGCSDAYALLSDSFTLTAPRENTLMHSARTMESRPAVSVAAAEKAAQPAVVAVANAQSSNVIPPASFENQQMVDGPKRGHAPGATLSGSGAATFVDSSPLFAQQGQGQAAVINSNNNGSGDDAMGSSATSPTQDSDKMITGEPADEITEAEMKELERKFGGASLSKLMTHSKKKTGAMRSIPGPSSKQTNSKPFLPQEFAQQTSAPLSPPPAVDGTLSGQQEDAQMAISSPQQPSPQQNDFDSTNTAMFFPKVPIPVMQSDDQSAAQQNTSALDSSVLHVGPGGVISPVPSDVPRPLVNAMSTPVLAQPTRSGLSASLAVAADQTRKPEGSPGGAQLKTSTGGADLNELANVELDTDGSSNGGSGLMGGSKVSTMERVHKQWKVKYTLRSHFDGVRSLAFHADDPVLLTGSEDYTVKLWNLRVLGSTGTKRSANSPDVEPLFTYRGHSGAVLSVAMASDRNLCFSAGADASVRVWSLPPLDLEPYAPIGQGIAYSLNTFVGHTDAIWDMSVHPFESLLLSASADTTLRLWNFEKQSPLMRTFLHKVGSEIHTPTSVTFLPTDVKKCIASYTSGHLAVFDIETGQSVWHTDTWAAQSEEKKAQSKDESMKHINKVVAHRTLPLALTAHEDRSVRFFDLNAGKCVHSMVAHLDAVSSLDIDSSGLYFVSAGHDSSLRIWDISAKHCVQELSAHRKKFDESVHCAAYHPTKSYIASGGADANIKVYQ